VSVSWKRDGSLKRAEDQVRPVVTGGEFVQAIEPDSALGSRESSRPEGNGMCLDDAVPVLRSAEQNAAGWSESPGNVAIGNPYSV